MKGARFIALALVLVAAPAPASAFVCTLNESSPFVSIHWRDRLIPYAIRAPGATSIAAQETLEIVQSAFDVWAQPRCSDLTFRYDGVVDPSTDPRTVSQVIFMQEGWIEGRRSGAAVALTTMTYGVNDGVIRFGVLEVNEEYYRFSDALQACDGDSYDLGAVLTHEVGHFLGLAHTDVPPEGPEGRAPSMTAMVSQCDYEFRSLEPDDIEGLCFIYPAGAPTRQCATLPTQEEPYVQSVPFGCTAAHRPSAGDSALWLAAAGLILGARRRWACSWRRSGG